MTELSRRAQRRLKDLEEEKPKAVSAAWVIPACRIAGGKAQKPRRLSLIVRPIVIGKRRAYLPEKKAGMDGVKNGRWAVDNGNVGGPASRKKTAKGRNPMNAVGPWRARPGYADVRQWIRNAALKVKRIGE